VTEVRCAASSDCERRMSADFLAAATGAAVSAGGDGATDVELCSHAPQQRLSSVQTRAAATSSAPFSRPCRAP